MPHHKSAKKRLRQSKEQRLRNRGHRTELRRAVKTARQSSEALPAAVSALDVAAQRGIIHRNKAARLKSRLTRQHQATKA
jgi:small subunit ribosomal protein S20